MKRVSRWSLILLSGCSMSLSGPSPDRPRNKAPQCDTSKGMVFVDGLMAATLGIVAASVASNNGGGTAVLPLIGAGVFTASAIHGNNVVNACNREFANYDSELASRAPLPDEAVPPRPVVAMQPAVALPSQPVMPAQLQPPPPQQQVALPPPPQASQPPPPPPREASSAEPWAAFWKESP